MIKLTRTSLPEVISHKNNIYTLSIIASNLYNEKGKWDTVNQLEETGHKVIELKVLHRNLRGVKDLHGNFYKPTTWIFTCYVEPKYKVVKIFRKSRRREIIERNLTRDEAKRLVNTYPDSQRSMVVFAKQ